MTGKLSRRQLLRGTGGALGLLAAGAVVSDGRTGGEPDEAAPGRNRTGGSGRTDDRADEWLSIVESGDRAEVGHRRPPTELDSLSGRAAAQAPSTVTGTATGTSSPTASATAAPATATPGVDRSVSHILPDSPYETPVYEVTAPRDGPTTMVVGGMHGDEKAGYLAAEHVAEWTVERGTLVVLPHANAPAIRRGRRAGEHGDLNRAFPATGRTEPTTRLARAIWAVVLDRDPDVLVDLHSSRGLYLGGEREGGVGQAVFPTDVRPAPRYAAETVRAIDRSLGLPSRLSYDRGNLLDGDRPMLAHRFGAVLHRPGFICETVETAPLKHQVSWHLFTVDYLMSLFDQTPIVD